MIAAGVGFYLLGYVRGTPSLPHALRGIVGSLLVLAAVGVPLAFVNSEPPGLLQELSHGFGQPLLYALFIVAVASMLRSSESARERLLGALALSILGQAVIVMAQFATGAAFDPVRGVTRAQGTVGANFLSAMAMLGFFVGLSLRTGSRSRSWIRLGTLTILASVLILMLTTTRGGFVGAAVGIAYLVMTGLNARGRRIAVGAAVVTLAVVIFVPPVADLWTSRLQTQGVAGFDRASTWISGVRMGSDDPLSGLGNTGVEEAISEDHRYQVTPAGRSSVVPHNIWILGFAQGGALVLATIVAFSVFALRAVLSRPRARSVPDRYLVAGLIAITVVAMINNIFTHPEVMLPTFAILTVVCGPVPAAIERARRRDASGLSGGVPPRAPALRRR